MSADLIYGSSAKGFLVIALSNSGTDVSYGVAIRNTRNDSLQVDLQDSYGDHISNGNIFIYVTNETGLPFTKSATIGQEFEKYEPNDIHALGKCIIMVPMLLNTYPIFVGYLFKVLLRALYAMKE